MDNVNTQSEELEITWGRVRSVWWLLVWRNIVGAMLLGAVVGAVWGGIAAVAGMGPEVGPVGGGILGLLVGIIWSLFVIRMALRKRYKGFRLALVPA